MEMSASKCGQEAIKCDVCKYRYACDDQDEFECKNNNWSRFDLDAIKLRLYDEDNAGDNMTFKEKLSARADKEAASINIVAHIEKIKLRLQEIYATRKFTLHLIDTMSGNFAIGGYRPNSEDLFIPKNIAPATYRQLFIDAFKLLGFTDADITVDCYYAKCYTSYDIILTW